MHTKHKKTTYKYALEKLFPLSMVTINLFSRDISLLIGVFRTFIGFFRARIEREREEGKADYGKGNPIVGLWRRSEKQSVLISHSIALEYVVPG